MASVTSQGSATRTTTGGTHMSEASFGDLVKDASTHFSTILRGEIELAKTEATQSAKRAGIGAGLLAAGGLVALLSTLLGFVALAEGLVTVGLWRWASYFIVFGVMLIFGAILAAIGAMAMKKMRKPTRAMDSMRQTTPWARRSSENR